jgi:hypothetical protein
MFGSHPTEKGWGMGLEKQADTETDRADARPEDPETNTQPRGNGDTDQQDTERGRDKLDSVLGQ